MNIRRFLSEAIFLDKDIEILKERICRLRELSTSVSSITLQEKILAHIEKIKWVI